MKLNKLKSETKDELIILLSKQKKILESNINYDSMLAEEFDTLDTAQERIAQIEISNDIQLDEL